MAETLHAILMAPFYSDSNNTLQVFMPENASEDYKEYIASFKGKNYSEISGEITRMMMLSEHECIAKYANAVMKTISENRRDFSHLPEIINACDRNPYTVKEIREKAMLEIFNNIAGSEQMTGALNRIALQPTHFQ